MDDVSQTQSHASTQLFDDRADAQLFGCLVCLSDAEHAVHEPARRYLLYPMDIFSYMYALVSAAYYLYLAEDLDAYNIRIN